MKLENLALYYDLRACQFLALYSASECYTRKEEQHMWYELLMYAEYMHDAKQLFNTFSDAEVMMLLDGRVPLFIVEKQYDSV
jgi:hypothetical protein